MLRAEAFGLLLQQDAEGALGQAGGRGGSDLLHGGEVKGAGLWVETSGNDFAPLCGELPDLPQLLLRRLALRHGQPSLRLARIIDDAFLFSLYRPVVGPAKCVLPSIDRPGAQQFRKIAVEASISVALFSR
jgi:hypothetical protein